MIRRRGDRGMRGQAYVEFILVLPLFLIIIAGIIGYGQAIYTKLAMEAAAWSACRHAIATLDEARAYDQAFRGARYTLQGFGLNADHATVHVTQWGRWGRGTLVRVRVCYDVPAPPVPLGQLFSPSQVCAQQLMPVNRYKSKW